MRKRVLLPDAAREIRLAKAESDPAFRLGQFATRCLMSSAHLCNVEAGRKGATEEVIHRIAAHLGVPISAISYEVPLEAAS